MAATDWRLQTFLRSQRGRLGHGRDLSCRYETRDPGRASWFTATRGPSNVEFRWPRGSAQPGILSFNARDVQSRLTCNNVRRRSPLRPFARAPSQVTDHGVFRVLGEHCCEDFDFRLDHRLVLNCPDSTDPLKLFFGMLTDRSVQQYATTEQEFLHLELRVPALPARHHLRTKYDQHSRSAQTSPEWLFAPL